MNLEERYLILKASQLSEEQISAIGETMRNYQIPSIDGLVVEADWPIFRDVVSMILHQDLYQSIKTTLAEASPEEMLALLAKAQGTE